MKMLGILAFASFFVFANTGCEETTAAVEVPDEELIVGNWQPSEALISGEPVRKQFLNDMTLTVDSSGQYITVKGNSETKGQLELTTATKPKQMIMRPHRLDSEPILAVYELNGDVLRVCYQPHAEFYPYKLESPEGSDLYLVEYIRVK